MPLYGGIDLHANNSVIVLLNEQDEMAYQKRLANHLPTILEQLAPHRPNIEGLVVESTYNWYWLVDGLMEADYRVHLANPAAIQQYSGLKYTDDHSDARWLAHLLRLGVLPEGYIYPKAERAVRDLLRKRAHLVRQHTANVLSVQNIMVRNTGSRFSVKHLHELTKKELKSLLPEAEQVLAVTSSLAILDCLSQQIKTLEKAVQNRLKHTPTYQQLWTVDGIGTILAQTISLETGDIRQKVKGSDLVKTERCAWQHSLHAPDFRYVRLRARSRTYGYILLVVVDKPGEKPFYLISMTRDIPVTRLIQAWNQRHGIEQMFRLMKHLLAAEACQAHTEDAYYGRAIASKS